MPRNNSRARKEQRRAAVTTRAKWAAAAKKQALEREKDRGHPQRFDAYIEQFVEHSKR